MVGWISESASTNPALKVDALRLSTLRFAACEFRLRFVLYVYRIIALQLNSLYFTFNLP